jgi:hypothetical protein
MKMLTERQQLIIQNVKIGKLVHISGHLNERAQSVIRETSQTHLRLEPDLAHNLDEMFHLALDALDAVRHLIKGKNVTYQTTLHSANQLLSTFGDFWPIEVAQLYESVRAMASCEVPDFKR